MLIAVLSVKLESKGFAVKQATGDADHLIGASAIVASEEHKCAVLVREDINLLIILTALASLSANIFFNIRELLKSGKGNSPNNLFSASNFKYSQCVKDPVPQSLLMAIFCKYAKRSTCSCRKSGIKFSANCANCKRHSCSTATPETDEQMLQLSEDDKDLLRR
ncbi:hypothetical protein AVEN_120060-1 [Araneus ventricosus]|uniref:Uncharacterized protein n=1 Tax=Araneus ventricosus TaxID=182803 RepID=A0A4Y2WWG6_ARAVE|nr:hypothetical protein AVEN_120060-1 [Araneus ventricosus]